MFRFFTCYLLKFILTFIVIVFQGPHVSVVISIVLLVVINCYHQWLRMVIDVAITNLQEL